MAEGVSHDVFTSFPDPQWVESSRWSEIQDQIRSLTVLFADLEDGRKFQLLPEQERAIVHMAYKIFEQQKSYTCIPPYLSMLMEMEVGTGKTFMSIVLFLWWLRFAAPFSKDNQRAGLCLLTMKVGILHQWRQSLEKTNHPLHLVIVSDFPSDKRKEILVQACEHRLNSKHVHSVVLCSIDTLKESKTNLMLCSQPWDVVLCDEIHGLGNPKTKGFEKLKEVVLAAHKEVNQRLCIGLSGTVITNNFKQIYIIHTLLNPLLVGILGSVREFNQQFDKPIIKGLNAYLGSSFFARGQEASARLLELLSNYSEKLAKQDIDYTYLSAPILQRRLVHRLPQLVEENELGLPILKTNAAVFVMNLKHQVLLAECLSSFGGNDSSWYDYDEELFEASNFCVPNSTKIRWSVILEKMQQDLTPAEADDVRLEREMGDKWEGISEYRVRQDPLTKVLAYYVSKNVSSGLFGQIFGLRMLALHPLLVLKDGENFQDFSCMIEFLQEHKHDEVKSFLHPDRKVPLWYRIFVEYSGKVKFLFNYLFLLRETNEKEGIEDLGLEPSLKRQRKIGVVSESKKILSFFEIFFQEAGIIFRRLDGTVPREERTEIQQEINDPTSDLQVVIMTRRTGGESLNFPGLYKLIILDPWYTNASIEQTLGRINRPGQVEDIFIILLLTSGTIEENMFQLGVFKKSFEEIQKQQSQDLEPGYFRKTRQLKMIGKMVSRLFTQSKTKIDVHIRKPLPCTGGTILRRLTEKPFQQKVGMELYHQKFPYIHRISEMALKAGALDVVNIGCMYAAIPSPEDYGDMMQELEGRYNTCSEYYGNVSMDQKIYKRFLENSTAGRKETALPAAAVITPLAKEKPKIPFGSNAQYRQLLSKLDTELEKYQQSIRQEHIDRSTRVRPPPSTFKPFILPRLPPSHSEHSIVRPPPRKRLCVDLSG